MSKCSFSLHKTLTTTRDGENGHHNSPLSEYQDSSPHDLLCTSMQGDLHAELKQGKYSLLFFFLNNAEHHFWVTVRSLKY